MATPLAASRDAARHTHCLDTSVASFYDRRMNEPGVDVQTHLQTLFADAIQSLPPCWEPCEWSRVYCLALRDGTRLFLKGTPRSRNEAPVMQRLNDLCSTCLPRVLVADLVPAAPWRWFLMEDAGCCDLSVLSTPLAIEAARTLGRLQQRALHDQTLPSWLTRCEGNHLQQQALAVCQWAMNRQAPSALDDLQRIVSLLQEARTFFGELEQQLAELPSTIVHGDCWSGNIAVARTNIRLIDWGDALWGVGGVSLVNLIMTSGGQLDNEIQELWEAYECGWEKPIRPSYREACAVASVVTNLVIDTTIARFCGQGPERLPGLLPGLWDLEELIVTHFSRS
jgi:hypothetical protein